MDDLQARAAAARLIDEARGPWFRVLAWQCPNPAHHVKGTPGCWPGPVAVCGRRVHAALGVPGLQPTRRPYPRRMAHYEPGAA